MPYTSKAAVPVETEKRVRPIITVPIINTFRSKRTYNILKTCSHSSPQIYVYPENFSAKNMGVYAFSRVREQLLLSSLLAAVRRTADRLARAAASHRAVFALFPVVFDHGSVALHTALLYCRAFAGRCITRNLEGKKWMFMNKTKFIVKPPSNTSWSQEEP